MMPSSVKVGVRPSIATRRSYSPLVRPCSATRAGVITGSPERGVTVTVTSGRHAAEDGLEEPHAVGRAEQSAAGALGVGHHAEHVARLVYDSGDVPLGAVGIRFRSDFPGGIRVAKDNTTVTFDLIENIR